MRGDDFRLNCLFVVLCAVAVGFGFWGLAHFCEAFYGYVFVPVLGPIYRSAEAGFDAHGRLIAELIGATTMLVIYLTYHDKTLSRLTHDFTAFCQGFETKRVEYQHYRTQDAVRCAQHLDEKNHFERELTAMKERNRILKLENDGLWRELEMATEPEKVVKREEQKAQEVAHEELLTHVGQTYWRDTR